MVVLSPPREGLVNGREGVSPEQEANSGEFERKDSTGEGGAQVCTRYCKKCWKNPRLGLEVQVGYSAIPAVDQGLWPSPQLPALSLQPFSGWIIGLGFQTR